jgi:hypothetical protein
MNSVQLLLNKVIGNDKQKKKDLIIALGYKNMNKGYRRLDRCVNSGFYDAELIEKMLPLFGINHQTIERVKYLSELENEVESVTNNLIQRLNFVPHLWRKHERIIPSPIFVVAFIGINALKYIKLPENIKSENVFKQLDLIKEIIVKDYDSKKEKPTPFGKITGYYFRSTFDDSYEFSTDGEFIGKYEKKIDEKDAELFIRGRSINSVLHQ